MSNSLTKTNGPKRMKLELNGAASMAHLGYCTNIHAAESWQDMNRLLAEHLPAIKSACCEHQAMGLGLRLSAVALASLEQQAHFEELLELMGQDHYVYTINGFPYGTFHNSPVKEQVYHPDWSEQARLDYSNALADLLAKLLPQDQLGTISTVPGTFKQWMPGRVDLIASKLIEHTAHLVKLKQQTGKHIMMTLEPEPCCMLETIDESIAFFEDHLYDKKSIQSLARLTGLDNAQAETAMREHIGLCYDVCHAAVEFEHPVASIKSLIAAGVAIGKLQISSALRLPEVTSDTPRFLQPFDEPVYLHQVIQRLDDKLTRFVDVGEAIKSIDQAIGSEWRCHYHVPVFLDELQDFSTTQGFLKEVLALQKHEPFTEHMEIETYTWDVLPEEYRNVGIASAIAREMNWVKDRLQ